MKKMKITATFKGKDGSLGYEHGKTYEDLVVIHYPNINTQVQRGEDATSMASYQSVYSFLSNWTDIKVTEE